MPPLGNDPNPAHLEWFRFAFLLTGSADAAQEILQQAFAEAASQISQIRGETGRQAWLVRLVREHALRRSKQATGLAAPERLLSQASALPEPERSAWALFHCSSTALQKQEELLGLRRSAYAKALANARQKLAPGESFPENALLQLHRPWSEDARPVAKAVQSAEKKPALQAQLAAQRAFDNRCHEEISQIPLPENFSLPELTVAPSPSLCTLLRQPAVLAIGFALLVVLGVCVLGAMHRMDNFPGKETVTELIEEIDGMNGTDWEQIKPTEAGKLADGFMLKGLDGYVVPQELESAKAVGWRTYKFQGVPVAVVALDKHNALLLVFRSADLHVTLNSLTWQIFQQEDRAVAARGDGENCYIVTFLGDTDEMVKYLHKMGAKSRERSKRAQ